MRLINNTMTDNFNKKNLLSEKIKDEKSMKLYFESIRLPLNLTAEDKQFLSKIEQLNFIPSKNNFDHILFTKEYDPQTDFQKLDSDIREVLKNPDFNLYQILLAENHLQIVNKYPNKFSYESFIFSKNQRELKIEIINFYNFMLNFFDKNVLFKMVYSFDIYNRFSSAAAAGDAYASYIFNVNDENIMQFIGFKTEWLLNEITYKDNNNDEETRDPIISGKPISYFVHEFGHILHWFLTFNKEERCNLNTKNFLTFDSLGDYYNRPKDFKTIISYLKASDRIKASDFLKRSEKFVINYYDFIFKKIEEKLEFKITSKNQKYLILLSLTRSEYLNRNINLETKSMHSENIFDSSKNKKASEVFAEIFLNWYMTPSQERSFFWEINNQYFQEKMFEFKNYDSSKEAQKSYLAKLTNFNSNIELEDENQVSSGVDGVLKKNNYSFKI